jgi:hypothetical protein
MTRPKTLQTINGTVLTQGAMWKKALQTRTNMLQRCGNPKHPRYATYGGKGITVCEAWKASAHAFIADLGLPPTFAHSLDRIKGEQGYTVTNCRWATPEEQSENRTLFTGELLAHKDTFAYTNSRGLRRALRRKELQHGSACAS